MKTLPAIAAGFIVIDVNDDTTSIPSVIGAAATAHAALADARAYLSDYLTSGVLEVRLAALRASPCTADVVLKQSRSLGVEILLQTALRVYCTSREYLAVESDPERWPDPVVLGFAGPLL